MIVGSGIDIVEIFRMKDAIEKWGDNFLSRIFTPREVKYASGRAFPHQHLAARFAAKEAVYKAIGDRTISWKDLTITNSADGKPVCHVKGLAPDRVVHLSISHSKYYAVASAVVETKE